MMLHWAWRCFPLQITTFSFDLIYKFSKIESEFLEHTH